MAGVDESLLNRAERPHDEGFNNGGPLTNLFPQVNLSQNCMILIVVLIVLILFKDQIMKSSVVKSISKSLK